MNNLLGKVTLYDFIAMVIPGLLVVLSFASLFTKEFYHFYKDIGNELIAGVLILIISYCVGWIVSEIGYILFRIEEKIRQRFLRNQKDNKCYLEPELLEKYKEALETYLGETIDDKNIEKYGNMSNALIQSIPKYARIHNYSSSKSFSKNLGASSLIVSIVAILHLIIICCQKGSVISLNGIGLIFISLFGIFVFVIMMNRYKKFDKKTNVYIAVYFIDFVKDMKEREKHNEVVELKVVNNGGRN